MSTLVKGQSSLYIVKEITEGVYAPETLVEEALEPLQDGLEFQLQREEIERSTLTSTIEAVEPRLGLKTITGTIPMEYKAGKNAGLEPRGHVLFESLMGGKRSVTTTTTTKNSGHTLTFISLNDGDELKYNLHDCILLKKPGAYEVRPIKEIVSEAGSCGLILAIPLMGLPVGTFEIEKTLTYFHDTNSPSMSVTHYLGGEIKEKALGLKVVSGTLEGWTANQTPSMSFSLEGLDLSREVGTPTLTPDFSDDAKVPVLQHACAWIGIEEVDYTELGLSIENTKADILSACSPTGKIGTRKTAFTVTASINPYMSADSVERWEKFENGTITSLFSYAFNPTENNGEYNQVVALWLPNVKITNMPAQDADGILLDAIEFKAFRAKGNDTLFLSFI